MAKITRSKFNTKYDFENLDKNLFVKANKIDKEKRNLSLLGRTRNIWLDIFLRFFKNKWNILFFTIIFIIIIAIYVGRYFVKFSPDVPISQSSTETIGYLKPSWFENYNYAEGVFRDFDIKMSNNVPWGIDKSLIISQTPIINVNDVPMSKVVYINSLAVETFLGTTETGKDVLSRLLNGAVWSLNLALIVATIETLIGVAIGIYLGYNVGKTVDTILMRFIEFFSAIPALLWMFIFALLIGTSFWSLALVLILTGWVGPIFSARMFTLKIKDSEFILAARSIGASQPRILYGHVLPNILGKLLVSFVLRIPGVIFFETILVFLGFTIGGANGNSIGNLINESRNLNALKNNIMYAISICLFLLSFTISLQMVALGIRDAFDPRVVK